MKGKQNDQESRTDGTILYVNGISLTKLKILILRNITKTLNSEIESFYFTLYITKIAHEYFMSNF